MGHHLFLKIFVGTFPSRCDIYHNITKTQRTFWLIKNVLYICLYTRRKLEHIFVHLNGASRGEFRGVFDLFEAFGLQETMMTLWTPKTNIIKFIM